MQEEAFQYHVLIIRLWQETATGPERSWRFALEQSATGTRRGFTNLQALLDALETITSDITGADPVVDSAGQAEERAAEDNRPRDNACA